MGPAGYQDPAEPGFGVAASYFACCFGVLLLLIGNTRYGVCKMKAIDASTWGKDSEFGNLIKWMNYMGTIHVVSGCVGCLALGPLSVGMRESCPCIGNVCFAVMTGLFGKLLLFFMFCLAFFSNLLGYFWLYMASLARNDSNSQVQGDLNYCAPEVWYLARICVNGFWFFAIVIIIKVGATAHKFFRQNEAMLDVIELGVNPDTGEKDSIVLPKRRVGHERQGDNLPR